MSYCTAGLQDIMKGAVIWRISLRRRICFKIRMRPDIEFINRLTQDAQSVIHKKMSADEVIMNHTMFPYYGRFLGKERRTEAYFALLNTDGNYRNLLPIPKAKRQRFLRYCPMCVNMDRDTHV